MTELTTVKVTGGLLPAPLLERIFAADPQLPGIAPQSYGLERGESVRRQASRSWLYLVDQWQDFRRRIAAAGEGESLTGITRERWLRILLRELGFHNLTVGRYELNGTSFPVSDRSGDVPVDLLGWNVDLDHKTPHVTARAPQSMLQELLNRDDSCLWGISSNGATLRLLRDSATLVGSSYVEFDLAAIFDGELFADFVRLYLICHESRFTGDPDTCFLEQWRGFAEQQGERALDQLRTGVEQAISILGTGFLIHDANPQLRARLDPSSTERITLEDLNRALLRLVYRMLFWFVAEDRQVLLQPDPPDADVATKSALRDARDRYEQYFCSARLRELARRRRGSRYGDLFDAVELVFDGLGTEGGIPDLAIPGIGGIFESKHADGRALPLDEPLAGARISNEALLAAVNALAWVKPKDGGRWRRVDFGNLGAEELGSVYESLLELKPYFDEEQRTYTLIKVDGNDRKESGSYYTPSSLVECLLDSALDPLLDEACAKASAQERVTALLDLTVCDPACGSGHFLVAAARRIAKRVAAEVTGDPEPSGLVVRAALRKVIGRCIYGVDINPMAAELARVSLWIEALEPGKPLSFLDENIRVGNSLLGTTPALLAKGIPDDAYKAIEGDDKKVVTALKKQNAEERDFGKRDLFNQSGIPVTNAVLAKRADQITHMLPESLEDLHIHQQRQAEQLESSAERRQQKLLADAWCAAFVQPKTLETRGTALTHAVLEGFASDENTLERAVAEELVTKLTRQYRFFHWHVEFPHIFRVGNGHTDIDPTTGWSGGFSCVIGNPPWERVKLQEQEFFAARDPKIAAAPNAAARKRMIADLETSEDPAKEALYASFHAELRNAAGWSHFLRESKRYERTGHGDINTYAVFAETARTVIGPRGRSGLVLPTGIATDATTAPFFRDLVSGESLIHVYGFRNNRGLFKNVGHGDVRFCLLAFAGRDARPTRSRFAFDLGLPEEIAQQGSVYTLSRDDILLVNPNTGTCPTFKSPRDAEITIGIYNHVPVLWCDDPGENPWGLSFLRMFDMANDSSLFRTRQALADSGWRLEGNVFVSGAERMLPLYEGKMIYHFDHRFGDYRDRSQDRIDSVLPRTSAVSKADATFSVLPRYWVAETEVNERLSRRAWDKGWLLGWRDIARSTDERTLICDALPRVAVGHKLPLAMAGELAELLYANLGSFVLDYVVRQKIAGTSMTFFVVKQLPVLPPDGYRAQLAGFVRNRVLELSYTAYDAAPFTVDLGDDGPPFRWDEERRSVMRAELDAKYFRLYGIGHDDVDYIMETFPIVKRKDEERYGSFRTKEMILRVYDAMAEAEQTGKPYETSLDPPPGQGPRHE
jgi:hypothetical protein